MASYAVKPEWTTATRETRERPGQHEREEEKRV